MDAVINGVPVELRIAKEKFERPCPLVTGTLVWLPIDGMYESGEISPMPLNDLKEALNARDDVVIAHSIYGREIEGGYEITDIERGELEHLGYYYAKADDFFKSDVTLAELGSRMKKEIAQFAAWQNDEIYDCVTFIKGEVVDWSCGYYLDGTVQELVKEVKENVKTRLFNQAVNV